MSVPGLSPPPLEPAVPVPEDAWIEVPQGRLFARTWRAQEGSGSPIVLLHDSLGCVELWRDFPALLSRKTGRTVTAYDRLGFGKSSARSSLPGLDFVDEEAVGPFPALCERLGLQRFVLFGHSVGGGMAVHCAARLPEACEALITESAQAFMDEQIAQGILAARSQFQQEGQMDRLRKYHGEKAQWVLDAWTQTWLHPAFAHWSLATVLPRVTCPLLAIHGAEDEYGPPRHAEAIAAACGGPARVEVLADTRHVPHREQAETVATLVQGFLA